jgi:hypothetical protein
MEDLDCAYPMIANQKERFAFMLYPVVDYSNQVNNADSGDFRAAANQPRQHRVSTTFKCQKRTCRYYW